MPFSTTYEQFIHTDSLARRRVANPFTLESHSIYSHGTPLLSRVSTQLSAPQRRGSLFASWSPLTALVYSR
ncbi:MAG TPA: hypothetical protein VIZ18_13960 [Ktedonobacteraceae bacterium]